MLVRSPLEQCLEKLGNYTAEDDLIRMAAGRRPLVLGMLAFHRAGAQHSIRADNKRDRITLSHLKAHAITCLFYWLLSVGTGRDSGKPLWKDSNIFLLDRVPM